MKELENQPEKNLQRTHDLALTLRVQESQGPQTRFADGGDLLFIHLRVSDDVGESAAFQELHDYPQLVADQVRAVHVDDVLVVVVAHNHYLYWGNRTWWWW